VAGPRKVKNFGFAVFLTVCDLDLTRIIQ